MEPTGKQMQHSQSDEQILHQRLRWLIGLRWYGVGTLTAAALVGHYALGLQFSLPALLLLALLMAGYNYYYSRRLEQGYHLPGQALQQIVLDVLTLSLTLFLTGGFENPFFTFYFFLVIIAWIILPPRQSLAIIGLVLMCFALLGLAPRLLEVDMALSDEGFLYLGEQPFHVVGAPISFVATIFITAYFVSVIMADLRKREAELQQARERAELELAKLDNILQRLETGLLVIGEEGRVEWVNRRLRQWFGEEGSDETVACYRVALAARQGYRSLRDSANPQSEHVPFHSCRLPTLDSNARDFEVIVSPIFDDQNQLRQVIALILDVTDQKKTQEQWAQAEKLAAIGQLAAGIAHEINTPLGTIRILAEDARDMVSQLDGQVDANDRSEITESLTTIHEQTTRCKSITQGLLNFSRFQERTTGVFEIDALLRQAIDLTRHRLRHVEVTVDRHEEIPPIEADGGQLIQVFCNLLINAGDALETAPEPRRIHIETAMDDDMITVRIVDNGPGIDSKHLPHIFDPFFTTKPVGKGTGLGLYISYNAVREMGGQLMIEPAEEWGAAAVIQIPRREAKPV